MSEFNHDAENLFEAIGTTRKEFEQKVNKVNDAVRLANPSKISQEVEILIGKLTPKELALLFCMTKHNLDAIMSEMKSASEGLDKLEGLLDELKASDSDTETGSFS